MDVESSPFGERKYTENKRATDLSDYRDQNFEEDREKQEDNLMKTTTLYVGNLSFYTTESQIWELFSRCGEIKRLIMGLQKKTKTPCGFCFVDYEDRKAAENCMRYVNGTKLDDRRIRVDWDAGFVEGRQYGRGKGGAQIRDDYRKGYDGGRGGFRPTIPDEVIEAEQFEEVLTDF